MFFVGLREKPPQQNRAQPNMFRNEARRKKVFSGNRQQQWAITTHKTLFPQDAEEPEIAQSSQCDAVQLFKVPLPTKQGDYYL